MRNLSILIAVATVSAAPAPSTNPRFNPVKFFDGRTEGIGRMKIAFGPTRDVRVHGLGRVLPDGTIVLTQDVDRENKPPEHREWRIRETAPGIYVGTLSDAGGPIKGETVNGRLHLIYRSKSGYAVEQWMTLSPDGRTASNRLTAKKMGVVVARLDETIRKTD
jgi:hypothetical protein